MQQLVSIIVPVYEVQAYLTRCLQSLMEQSYENIEIIVVIDGSPDDSLTIAKELAAKDSRLRVFYQENQGVSAARNYGLKMATGMYCAFVDGDDYLDTSAIELTVRVMEETKADCVNFEYRKVDEDGEVLEEQRFIHGVRRIRTPRQKLRFLLDDLLVYRVGYEVCDKLFRMEIIRKHNLTFTVDCKMGEDLGFVMRYCLYATSVFCMEACCYNYVVRKNSAMDSAHDFVKNMEGYTCFLKGVYDTVEKDIKMPLLQTCYPLIFAKAMENPLRGHSVVEIEQVMGKLSHKEFFLEQIKEISTKRKFFREKYGSDNWRNIWRSYVALDVALTDGTRWKRLYMEVYNRYRKKRYGDTVKTMKQV